MFHCVPKHITFCSSIHLLICVLCFQHLVVMNNAALNIGVYVWLLHKQAQSNGWEGDRSCETQMMCPCGSP